MGNICNKHSPCFWKRHHWFGTNSEAAVFSSRASKQQCVLLFAAAHISSLLVNWAPICLGCVLSQPKNNQLIRLQATLLCLAQRMAGLSKKKEVQRIYIFVYRDKYKYSMLLEVSTSSRVLCGRSLRCSGAQRMHLSYHDWCVGIFFECSLFHPLVGFSDICHFLILAIVRARQGFVLPWCFQVFLTTSFLLPEVFARLWAPSFRCVILDNSSDAQLWKGQGPAHS